MGGKNFLLFFENVGDFLLEGEVVLSDIVVLQSRLHDIHVFFNFLLVNSVNFWTNFLLDLLLYLFVFFLAVDPIALEVSFLLLRLVDQGEVGLLSIRSRSGPVRLFLLPSFSPLGLLFDFHFLLVGHSWIVGERRSLLFWNGAFVLIGFGILFFLLDVLQTLYFLDVVFWKLVLNIFIFTLVPLVHLVEHFVHFWVVLEPVSVPQGVQAVVGRWRPWRYAGDHHHLRFVLLRNKGVSQDQSQFWCSEGHVVSLVPHSSYAFL